VLFVAKVIAVYNKKGGCGKTTTATTLAYLLARCGKRTALIDLDSQGDSSLAYGVPNPDKLQTTILSLVKQVIIGEPLPSPSSYMYSYHGVDLVPSNEEISTLERNLSNVDFREYILKEYISQISPSYDYIIIDCMPNFDTSMLNVMVCADSVVIPTQAEYYRDASGKQAEQWHKFQRLWVRPQSVYYRIKAEFPDGFTEL